MAVRLTAAPKAMMAATSTMVEAIISFSIVSPSDSLHRPGDRSCDCEPIIWVFAPRRINAVQNLERCTAWGLVAPVGERKILFCMRVSRTKTLARNHKNTRRFFCKRQSRSLVGPSRPMAEDRRRPR
jgi:hypothetical protein